MGVRRAFADAGVYMNERIMCGDSKEFASNPKWSER